MNLNIASGSWLLIGWVVLVFRRGQYVVILYTRWLPSSFAVRFRLSIVTLRRSLVCNKGSRVITWLERRY